MKTYKPYDPDQELTLPPDVREWLPEHHLSQYISDVVDALDLSVIYGSYEQGDDRGQPPYHPLMMTKLVIYSYCVGKVSSRRIERATYEDVAYRVLATNQHPDHDSIAAFRKRHLKALEGLFEQVLELCETTGLVQLGHIALDGTKIKANASKHKAMSYGRMEETEAKLESEIAALLKAAEAADAAEDVRFGKGRRGDELPKELQRRESRLAKIKEAKQMLEAQAREKAEATAKVAEQKIQARRQEEAQTGKKAKGREPIVPDVEAAKPEAKAQRNFTDPESRIMKDGATKSFEQCYNAQACVDQAHQIIVAYDLVDEANDKGQLVPMLCEVHRNTGHKPKQASADSGYFAEGAVTDPRLEGIDLYVAPDRKKHNEGVPGLEENREPTPVEGQSVTAAMRAKLSSIAGQAAYGLRKSVVEPVFGQIKEARGFRRFSFRGKGQAKSEWGLICLTHNLLKLFRASCVCRAALGG